jgi:hypothetical protein
MSRRFRRSDWGGVDDAIHIEEKNNKRRKPDVYKSKELPEGRRVGIEGHHGPFGRSPLQPGSTEGKTRPLDQNDFSEGWCVYFRIYGLEQPAFDGSWKPKDFEETK